MTTLVGCAAAGAVFTTLEALAIKGVSPDTEILRPVGIGGAPFAGAAAGTCVFTVREGLRYLRGMPKPVQAGVAAIAVFAADQALKSSTRHVERNKQLPMTISQP